MRVLSSHRHEIQIYPRGFRWCLREAVRVAGLVAVAVGFAHFIGVF